MGIGGEHHMDTWDVPHLIIGEKQYSIYKVSEMGRKTIGKPGPQTILF